MRLAVPRRSGLESPLATGESGFELPAHACARSSANPRTSPSRRLDFRLRANYPQSNFESIEPGGASDPS
jgi:hypothetical protein